MIPFTKIKNVIQDMADEIGLTMIRGDQMGRTPPYPFGVYTVISAFQEGAYQDIKAWVENAQDPTSVDNKRYEKSQAVISLQFKDKNRVDRITTHATNAFQYFKSIAGREYAKSQEITVQLLGTDIEDRTTFVEAFQENVYGFDVRLDYTALITETIEAVETITLGQTRDGESLDDVVVEEP